MSISGVYEGFNELRNKAAFDLLEPQVIADANSSISQIIGTLIDKNSNDVFIPLSGKVAAITIRDLLGVRNITSTKPSVLGKIIPTLNPNASIAEAVRLMSLYRLRALPLVEKNDIVGQISAKRIIQEIRAALLVTKGRKIGISDIMTRSPIVVSKNDKIPTAKQIMKRRRIDHLPVLHDNHLAGIVTSKDIIQLMLPTERIGRQSLGIDGKEDRYDVAVGGISEKNVLIANTYDTLQSVTDKIVTHNSTYCVITAFDEVQGIVTYRDIITLLGEKVEQEIPIFLIGLPEDPLDAELAKSKFANLVKLLKKIYPDIEEARCRLKIRNIQGSRKRYEVDANIISTQRIDTYVSTGWDLAALFDQMSDSLKKRISHKITQRQKGSRYRTRPAY
jgi:CBS domain-containing protein